MPLVSRYQDDPRLYFDPLGPEPVELDISGLTTRATVVLGTDVFDEYSGEFHVMTTLHDCGPHDPGKYLVLRQTDGGDNLPVARQGGDAVVFRDGNGKTCDCRVMMSFEHKQRFYLHEERCEMTWDSDEDRPISSDAPPPCGAMPLGRYFVVRLEG